MRVVADGFRTLLIAAAALCGLSGHAFAAGEQVTFPTATYLMGQIQQRLARERGEPTPAPPDTIQGYLSKPDGDGPFAAVVYLHGCAGLSTGTRDRIGKLFTGWGYVTLAVDSFTTRGIKAACNDWPPDRKTDALGALIYLSKLPFVDAKRIAVVGASQGGMAVLSLASQRDVRIFATPGDLHFKAAVAFYPLCSVAADAMDIPTIILIGKLDDWMPAKNCEQWMGLRSGHGARVKLFVYPGAYHDFDNPGVGDGVAAFGHVLRYDADAAQRATAEMKSFLGMQLSN